MFLTIRYIAFSMLTIFAGISSGSESYTDTPAPRRKDELIEEMRKLQCTKEKKLIVNLSNQICLCENENLDEVLGEVIKIPSIVVLILNDNTLKDKHAAVIAKRLETNTNIQKIYLYNNNITNAGVKALAEALIKNQSIEYINLGQNSIKNGGMKFIADMLKLNRVLKHLDLSENYISREGLASLADGIGESMTLEGINLSGRNHIYAIGDQNIGVICNALKKNKSIKFLILSSNNIGPDGAKIIADMLMTDSSLIRIELDHNVIGDKGAIYIASALEENKGSKLKQLSLNFNSIHDTGIEAVAKIVNPKELIELGLEGNFINGQLGQKALEDTIKKNSSLKILKCPWGSPGWSSDFSDKHVKANISYQNNKFEPFEIMLCSPDQPTEVLEIILEKIFLIKKDDIKYL